MDLAVVTAVTCLKFPALYFSSCCLFKSSEECLWGPILNKPVAFLSDLVLWLGGMGGMSSACQEEHSLETGASVLPPDTFPSIKKLILCNPHHVFGTEKETDIIIRMVVKEEGEIEREILLYMKEKW